MEQLKELFTGKKGKIMIGVTALVVLFALYSFSRRSKVSEPTFSPVLPNTGEDNETAEQFKNLFNELESNIAEEMGKQKEQTSRQQEILSGLAYELTATKSGFAELFKGLSFSMVDFQDSVSNELLALNEKKLSESVEYLDLGNGGVNYYNASSIQKRQIEDNERRLKTDPSFVTSEIERAKKVIADRQSQGLSTKDQTEYLKRLETQKAS